MYGILYNKTTLIIFFLMCFIFIILNIIIKINHFGGDKYGFPITFYWDTSAPPPAVESMFYWDAFVIDIVIYYIISIIISLTIQAIRQSVK
jgi:hypothetical protein